MGRTWRGAGGFLTDGTNEIEDKAELFVGELQLGISSRTPHRENREDAPTGHTLADEILMDVGKFGDITTVDTCDHIVGNPASAPPLKRGNADEQDVRAW